MAIQKIWDIVQDFTKLNCVVENIDVITLFETTLQPAFELIQNAQVLDFDDSILKTMSFFIESSKMISQTMAVLFEQLPIVFMKYKMIHKDFFRLIKAYINFGKEFILSEKV